jgi:hypothetical protein
MPFFGGVKTGPIKQGIVLNGILKVCFRKAKNPLKMGFFDTF